MLVFFGCGVTHELTYLCVHTGMGQTTKMHYCEGRALVMASSLVDTVVMNSNLGIAWFLAGEGHCVQAWIDMVLHWFFQGIVLTWF